MAKTVNAWLQKQLQNLLTNVGGAFSAFVQGGASLGGAVTQLTSRTTAVTLNKMCGAITLFGAAGSTTAASFTVNNSMVNAGDVIALSQKSGTDKYDLSATAVADGSFQVTSRTYAGTTNESPVFNFVVIKALAS